ncbi:ABC transporter transmembrane domain-containing protein [Leucobacter chromiireducens]|uniref:ABC transporter transmembrane domain-containing protein n=1 Tax=Leucobacter chromiireducens TaxID=283877 RepID=UPI000F6394F2|nr:ABC transporter ATP-binding protein [Leucobacter chromiireducens]
MTVTPAQLFRIALAGEGRGRALACATALLVLHALAETAIPVLIGVVVDRAVLRADAVALAAWLGALLAVFLVLTLSYQGASRLMVTVYGTGEQALRHLALTRLLRRELPARSLGPGEALGYVTSDTYRVAGVAWSVAQQSATVAAIVAAAGAMLVISPAATLVVFLSTGSMMFVMRLVSRPLEQRGHAEQTAATEAGAVAADFMTGFRVLVGMGARGEAVRRYAAASERSRGAATAAGRALAGAEAVSATLAALTTAGLAGLSAWFASAGSISIGELVTVLGLAQFVSGFLAHAGTFPANWAHKLASARRLASLINTPDLLPQPERGEPVRRAADVVLSVRSSAHTARIDVRRGETLGIRPVDTAAARAASRTLGLRAPVARGELTLSGPGDPSLHRDARDVDLTAYRSRVVSLPHRQAVASESLRAAVLGPAAAATSATPRPAAVSAAALTDVVAELGGWDTALGEAGRRVSGGQRQRIGIARALHAGAEVLVLDEPTSAVDAVTEAAIAAGLSARPETIVLISSSPTLLAACDRVVEWGAA